MTRKSKTKLSDDHRKLMIRAVISTAKIPTLDVEAINEVFKRLVQNAYFKTFPTPELRDAAQVLLKAGLLGRLERVTVYCLPLSDVKKRNIVSSQNGACVSWYSALKVQPGLYDASPMLMLDELLPYSVIDYRSDEDVEANKLTDELDALYADYRYAIEMLRRLICQIEESVTVEELIERLPELEPIIPDIVNNTQAREFLRSSTRPADAFVQMDGAGIVNAVTEGAQA